jgi:predicted nuclease with RNAse H fold
MSNAHHIGTSDDSVNSHLIDSVPSADEAEMVTIDVPLSESEYARLKVLADYRGCTVEALAEALVKQQLAAMR